ncbi:unnamed protein product [Adineta steineri]|uniref:Uncharacterized protein n=1 Tax=Adineta steineri TaxID=433720 RepID=A0A815S7K3_9BILA|nr:unnamed protein product [Adineta steineri]CAF1486816.1 unnamed protein product [Adineta steineri]
MNIPSLPPQQGSNDSSVDLGVNGKESSSSSNYTKEESDELIENNNDTHEELFYEISNNISFELQIQHKVNELKFNENTTTRTNNEEKQEIITKENNTNDKKPIANITSTKNSKSSTNCRKETSITSNISSSSSLSSKTSLAHDLILSPKPPLSISSKLRVNLPEIQSVSFIAGTFAPITTDESSRLSLTNQGRLNINLSRKLASTSKTDSTFTCKNFDEFLHQIRASLSSFESTNNLQKSSSNNKNCDFCSCKFCPDFSNTNDCITCMSISNNTMISCAFNPRNAEAKQRLKLKINKRTVQNTSDQ